jgi:predicted ArsR family transcriptional regulator
MDDMPQGRRTVTDDEIICWMEAVEGPAVIARELAEQMDISAVSARDRLEELTEEGRVHRKKPSSRTVIYWPEAEHDRSLCSA